MAHENIPPPSFLLTSLFFYARELSVNLPKKKSILRPVHGRGVFALRDFAEGETVEVCPVVEMRPGRARPANAKRAESVQLDG